MAFAGESLLRSSASRNVKIAYIYICTRAHYNMPTHARRILLYDDDKTVESRFAYYTPHAFRVVNIRVRFNTIYDTLHQTMDHRRRRGTRLSETRRTHPPDDSVGLVRVGRRRKNFISNRILIPLNRNPPCEHNIIISQYRYNNDIMVSADIRCRRI